MHWLKERGTCRTAHRTHIATAGMAPGTAPHRGQRGNDLAGVRHDNTTTRFIDLHGWTSTRLELVAT